MIFVTVGTQFPFDRLILSIDEWAKGKSSIIHAQIGNSLEQYQNIQTYKYLEEEEINQFFRDAKVIVAHAGMGSIINALTLGKHIIVMPRNSELGEHRNMHQYGTAKHLMHKPGVHVAWNIDELKQELNKVCDNDYKERENKLSKYAPDELLVNLKKIIDE